MSVVVLILILYLGLLFGLAYWSRRSGETLSGYYLAERRLPWWVVAFSTNATGESGWLLLGLTGMGYAVGAQAFWVVAGEVTGIALAWILVSRRLKRLSDRTDSITVPDVLTAKLGDRLHLLRLISVFVILSMVGTYVAAQLVASGKAFNGFMAIDYEYAVLLGAAVVIAYTFVGGHKAVAYTDFIQGVMMLVGLVLVPVVAIGAAGGWNTVTTTLAQLDPALLSLWGNTDNATVAFVTIVSFLAVGLPFLGVPQLMVRFMSARSDEELKKARIMSVLVILLFDIGAVTAGMAGRALFPGLDDPETILPLLSTELFPPVITGLLLVTILAAIMSTADSLLLLASSALVRDFLQRIVGSARSDHRLAHYGKFVTLIIGAAATAVALLESPLIFWFVLFSWSGLGAAFGPVILCILYYPRTTWRGAVAGVMSGFLTVIVWVLFIKESFFDLYEMIPGFIVGLFMTIAFSGRRATRTKPRLAGERA